MLLPLFGIDGLGSELGFTALLVSLSKIVYEILKEKKSRKTAVDAADKIEMANGDSMKTNPSYTPISKRLDGKTSPEVMLHIIIMMVLLI